MNTYAETAPTGRYPFFEDQKSETWERGDFQIGADRILIRTVTHPSYGQSTGSAEEVRPPRQPSSAQLIIPSDGEGPGAWICLQRRTWPSLFDKLNYMVDDGRSAPPRSLFAAKGGFIVVSGYSYTADLRRPPRRVLTTLAFARHERAARTIARRVKSSHRYVRVKKNVVLASKLPVAPRHARQLLGCIGLDPVDHAGNTNVCFAV